MRWLVLVVLALFAVVPAQASFHEDDWMNDDGNVDDGSMGDGDMGDGNTDTTDGDDVDVNVDDNDNQDETVGAGRDSGDGGLSTPWVILLVLGVLVVVAVIAALLMAGRDRH